MLFSHRISLLTKCFTGKKDSTADKTNRNPDSTTENYETCKMIKPKT